MLNLDKLPEMSQMILLEALYTCLVWYDLGDLAYDIVNLTKGEFIDKYKTQGPLREAQLEVGQATYQKLKDMLFKYMSIRNKVVEKIHDPSSIIYKAVKEDRRLKMTPLPR